ncbi:NHL repeat-containing protein [Turneriella parva]|nr:NHL repeat-containing protein [Turneriella parva]
MRTRNLRFFTQAVLLGLLLCALSCANAGSTLIELAPDLPPSQAPLLSNAPGSGPSGGPVEYSFWIKDRRANAPAGLAAYSQKSAKKLASTAHFVLYGDQSAQQILNSSTAKLYLDFLEPQLSNLKQIYGDGVFPDLQKTGRIVILALDIQDDYAGGSSGFISGYFAPRDLFNDAYTSALFSDTSLINSVSLETLAEHAGRSNMLPMVYADVKPFLNGDAFSGDLLKSQNLFREMLLHECSHLFTYYFRHVYRNLPRLPTFLAEGLAENAPMLTAGLFASQRLRLADFSDPIVQYAFKTPVTLSQWIQGESEKPGYVRANLFMNYLRHRSLANAGQVTRQIVSNNGDMVSLNTLIGSSGIAGGMSTLYHDFVVSLYIASGGFNLQTYIEAGTTRDVNAGSPQTLKQSLSFASAGINKFGESGVAFLPALNQAPLPAAFAATTCLPPLSFQIYHYYTLAGETFKPTEIGADGGLKFVVAYHANSSLKNIELHKYSATDNISLTANVISGGVLRSFYHIIVINDQLTGSCKSPGNLPRNLNEGNIAAWVGGGKSGWQGGPGAANGNLVDYFMRTAGLATNIAHAGRSKTYFYTTDYLNHKVARYEMASGSFAGVLGDPLPPSENSNCARDSEPPDTFKLENRTYQNYCRRSFNAPRAVATTTNGDIIVADTDNHRLVLYSADGAFVAWLGDQASDRWQCETGRSHPYCSVGQNASPVSAHNLAAAPLKVNMFYYPAGLSIDESETTKYIYVSNYGNSRIVRRNLETGEFAGFIGNGYDAWNTSITLTTGATGSTRNFLHSPTGITHDETYIYIADTNNHRISRYLKNGVQADHTGSVHSVFIGGNTVGWHDGPTNQTNAESGFKFPSAVYLGEIEGLDNQVHRYLFVADTANHRISRILLRTHEKANPTNISWAAASRGWLGAGFLNWQSTANAYDYSGLTTSQLFPPEFIYSPQAVLFMPASASGLTRDYLLVTATYSARVSRWNFNCLWQQDEQTTFNKNCAGEP